MPKIKAAPARECHSVYILECADGTLYTGSTNNVPRRLLEHNVSKRGARYTKYRRPVRLVYSEVCSTLSLARKREAALKRLSRQEKCELAGIKYQTGTELPATKPVVQQS